MRHLITLEQAKALDKLFDLSDRKKPESENYLREGDYSYSAYSGSELGEILGCWRNSEPVSRELWPYKSTHGWTCQHLTEEFETETQARAALIIFYIREDLKEVYNSYISVVDEIMQSKEYLFNKNDFLLFYKTKSDSETINPEDYHEEFFSVFNYFHDKIISPGIWENIDDEDCEVYKRVIKDCNLWIK